MNKRNTPPRHENLSNKRGFTLAEVLITLVIVGVIAAITVPVAIANYQEHVTVSKVRKFYSTMSKAYNRAIADNGPVDSWDIPHNKLGGSAILYADYLKPYLNIIKDCNETGLTDSGGYKADTNCSIKVPDDTHYLNGETWKTSDYNTTQYAKFILADGASAWLRASNGGATRYDHIVCNNGGDFAVGDYKSGNICGLLWVDVNGFDRGPNRMGRDIFNFIFTPDGLKAIFYGQDDDCYIGGSGWRCSAWVLTHGNTRYPSKKS